MVSVGCYAHDTPTPTAPLINHNSLPEATPNPYLDLKLTPSQDGNVFLSLQRIHHRFVPLRHLAGWDSSAGLRTSTFDKHVESGATCQDLCHITLHFMPHSTNPLDEEINQAFVPHIRQNEVPHALILYHIKYTLWQSNPPHLEKYGT